MMDDIQRAIENLNTSGVEVSGQIRRVAEFYGALDAAIIAMQELLQYREIGTLDEYREAREKQKAKKPIEDRHDNIRYTEVYRCPVCNNSFSGRGYAKYCYHCGQKLDWREDE